MTVCELCEDDVKERQRLDFGDDHSMYVCRSCHKEMSRKIKNTKNIYKGPEK